MAIAENGAFWDDRDISNSSVERIAVPELAATVEHMLFTMTQVIMNLHIDEARMRDNAADPRTASSILQTLAQKRFGLGPVEASNFVKQNVEFDTEDGCFRLSDTNSGAIEPGDLMNWLNEADELWTKVRT